MHVTDANLGAANLLRNKNDQIERARRETRAVQDGLIESIGDLKSAFDALSQRNEMLEGFIASLVDEGVASEALPAIHSLKASYLQKQADEEYWTIAKKREANLRLAAEAEYDYRLKNDPSYRLTVAADSLMKAAAHSENGDMIRKIVGQMYATGKIKKQEEREKMIEKRIEEMRASARYETPKSVVPVPKSIPPMKLEFHENDKETYESLSQVSLNPSNLAPGWIK